MNKAKIVNTAQKYLQKGAYDKAIRELEKLVEEDPRDVRTLLKIGDICAKKGDREEAIKVYRRVAEAYSDQGFFLKAVAVYKQILKHDPQHLEVTIKLAELYEHLGLSQEALAQYQLVANLHEERGDKTSWLGALERMIDLDPENVASRVRLAEALSREGMVPQAIEQFAKAADLLRRQDRQSDYVKVAERLVFHDPSRLEVLKDLARVYLSEGDHKRALAKLQLCFKTAPRDIETLTMLGRAFREGGHQGKAVYVYHELARAFLDEGAQDAARSAFETVLELDPNDAEARRALGVAGPATMAAAPRPRVAPTMGFNASAPATAGPVTTSDLRGASIPQTRPAPAPASAPTRSPAVGRVPATTPAPTTAPVLVPTAKPLSARMSPRALQEQVTKLLTETDVYVKYGLRDKALDHLGKVLELDPSCVDAYLKARDLYLAARDHARAAEALGWVMRLYNERGQTELADAAQRQLAALSADHQAVARRASVAPKSSLFSGPHEADEGESFDIDVATGDLDDEGVDPFAANVAHESGDLDIHVSTGTDEIDRQEALDAAADVGELDIVDSADLPHVEQHLEFDQKSPTPWSDGAQPLRAGLLMTQSEQEVVARVSVAPAPPNSPMELEDIDRLDDDALVELTGEENIPSSVDVLYPHTTALSADAKAQIAADLVTAEFDAPSADEYPGGSEPLSFEEPSVSKRPELTGEEMFDGDTFGDAELMSILGEEDPLALSAPGDGSSEEEDLDVELESAEFLEAQGLMGEAREAILEVLKRSPFHERAVAMLDRVEIALGMRAHSEAASAPASEEEVLAALTSVPPGEVDTAEERSSDPAEPITASAASPASNGEEAEADRHLDLGYSYREMGMLAEAIAEFDAASRVPSRAAEALEMMGYSVQAQGDTLAAVTHFYRALEQGAAPDRVPRLKYEIGMACEAAGDFDNALAWYGAAYSDDPEQPHLRTRIENLGADPEQLVADQLASSGPTGSNGTHLDGSEHGPPGGLTPEEAQRNAKKSKISYL